MTDKTCSDPDNTRYLQTVLRHVPQLVWFKDVNGVYLACNTRFEAFCGAAESFVVGKTDYDFFDFDSAWSYRSDDQRCMRATEPVVYEEWMQAGEGGKRCLLEITKVAMRDSQGMVTGVMGIGLDITQRHQLAQFETFRSRVLELLAEGSPQSQVLDSLALGVQQLQPGMRCTVLLVAPDGRHLVVGAAPDLPDFFVAALDGLIIKEGYSGCATAALTGQRVVVADMAAHPGWKDYGTLALRAGLGACWSQPVLAADGVILGVLAIYHQTARAPTEADMALLEQLARIASIAVEQHQAADRLRDSEERFRALAENTPEAILVHHNTCIAYVNPAAIRLFGAVRQGQLLGTSTLERIHPDFLEQQLRRMEDISHRRAVDPVVESRFLRLDGSAFDVEVQGTPIVFAGQEAIQISVRDITQRKQIEQRLELAASVFNHAREGIYIAEANGTIIDVNDAFTRITGYERSETLGRKPSFLRSSHHSQTFYEALWQHVIEHGSWSGELWNRRKTGEVYVQMQHISAVSDAQGQVRQYVAFFSDVTARKEQEARLDHMAHFDALTGLPNRALHADRLQQAMAQATRRGQKLGLAFVDLDGFKAVNDNYGHDAGDHLLITLARRMRVALREVDTLARIGGDEFAAVIVDLDQASDCDPLLQRLLVAASQPVIFNGLVLQVSASVGVAFYPQAQDLTPDQLLRQADLAMYQAKQSGKNQYQVSGHADFSTDFASLR
jgi:diguanylate cyclase (GGDEF)-like protein/PAS domain S-box-containing protein